MNKPNLVTIDEAARQLGVPKGSLRTAAETHGFLVRMGRALRIDSNDFSRLVKKCQDQAREQGSTSSSTGHTGTSEIRASQTGQRAALAAQRLKKSSQRTSPQKGGKVLPMNRQT